MARIRTIKPELFHDEDIGELSPIAILVWIGLWTQADRAGRFKWRPKTLATQLLPFHKFSMDNVLAELTKHDRVKRYEVDGQWFGQVIGWHHQKLDKANESQSKLPPCPDFVEPTQVINQDECTTTTSLDQDVDKSKERKGKERKGRGTRYARPVSVITIGALDHIPPLAAGPPGESAEERAVRMIREKRIEAGLDPATGREVQGA